LRASHIKKSRQGDSKFNGVQIGAITYSFRSLPCNVEQILKYCIDCKISAIELMGPTAEAFAGAPFMNTEPVRPGEQRPQLSQEEQARSKALADWRSTVSMDKFIQLKKMYKDAGVNIYAWNPSALE
jgi:hypothetical protein